MIPPTTHRPNDHAPAAPAGFTRAGQPLSARPMAARARWSHAVTTHVARKAARTDELTRATSEPRGPNQQITSTGTVLLNETRGHFY